MHNRTSSTMLAAAIGGLAATAHGAAPIAKDQLAFFESKIRPALIANCYDCHSAGKKIKGGLQLDSREAARKGGSSGPAVVPGDLTKSLLIQAVRYQDPDMRMPPKAKLPDSVIADLEKWVRMGAPDPREGKGATYAGGYGKEVMEHWAYQPVRKPAVPKVQDQRWVRNPIDAFVLAKLEAQGMKPAGRADQRTLIRRACLDAIGLPPEPRKVQAFLEDNSPRAFESVVDELLRSNHYGERWARHWLDTARYSDTKGQVRREDPTYAFAWTYRDYVIRAFNSDKPYDQFITEQVAADLVNLKDQKDLAALGFLTLGDRFGNNRHDIIDDRIDVISKGFLGMTVACARCHDHKFDPIPTADYYGFYGILANTQEPKEEPILSEPPAGYFEDYKAKIAPHESKIEEVDKLLKLPRKEFEKLFAGKKGTALNRERQNLQRQRENAATAISLLDLTHPGAPMRAHVINDVRNSRDYPVFIKGDASNRGEMAPRQFLDILSNGKPKPYTKGSGRLELARDLGSKSNPITARVMVNRVWMHLFGEGFVPTPDDLGVQSEPPVHRELIDWLAVYFMENDWSVKKLISLVLNSNTYQQGTEFDPRDHVKDPRNRYYWRQNVRRLEFEVLRDTILTIGGSLDERMYGRPTQLFMPRRSIYAFVDRTRLEETMANFDFANPGFSTGRREETIVPLQALFMMNSSLVVHQAKQLVARPQFHKMSSYEERLGFLYENIYGRLPSSEELRIGTRFIDETKAGDAKAVREQLDELAEIGRKQQADRIAAATKAKAAADNAKKGKGAPKMAKMGNESKKALDELRKGMKDRQDLPSLTSWQKFAHALFMGSEMFYVE